MGAVKGLAKGVAGTPVKFFAGKKSIKPLQSLSRMAWLTSCDLAMSGSVGYSLKGLDVEISKAFNGKSRDVVWTARISQGEQEYSEASDAMKKEIVRQWHLHRGSGSEKG
jgi:hypothetical protein